MKKTYLLHEIHKSDNHTKITALLRPSSTFTNNIIITIQILPAVVPEHQIQGPALWFDPDPPTWPVP